MNPLSVPVGIAARVMGDLAAIAAAARAAVPVAESIGQLDMRRLQSDIHTLAATASALPRIEENLTQRMDVAEETVERAVKAAEALVEGMPEIVAGIDELRAAREAAEAIVASLPVIESGVAQLRQATAAAEKLTEALPTLERAADAGEKLVGGLDEVRASRETLLEAKGEAQQLIAAAERAQAALDRASDNVELALARAEPLQGLTERIARLNERLPGGGRNAGTG